MRQAQLITLTADRLRSLYVKNLPGIYRLAVESSGTVHFVEALRRWLLENTPMREETRRTLLYMLDCEGKDIEELSRGECIRIGSFEMLYHFLCSDGATDCSVDAMIDLYCLFSDVGSDVVGVSKTGLSRWVSGTDDAVVRIRERNKRRMIPLLVEKVSLRSHVSVRFHFEEGMQQEEKERLVETWWNDFRFHIAMAVKSPAELNRFLGNTLSKETLAVLAEAKKKQIPFFVTPYYLSLLNIEEEGYDDAALRSYVLYSRELVDTFGRIRAWEKEDCVVPGKPNAAGWLLPEGGNIHRRYPEVAILIPDTMGRACGGLCASCQRMYDFQSRRFNFDLENLKPKETWPQKLHRLMAYFENDTQLRDILVTGGDAFMSQNKTLKGILDAIYQMARRKREANLKRPEGEKYAEIQRVRLGTRLPAYLPMRIDDGLIEVLTEFRQKAERIGIRQFIIQTHFQTPLEMTPEAREGIRRLLACGWLVTNQLVYNVAASRRGHTARLRQVLNREGVMCYYTFSVKGFAENRAVYAPNSRLLQEQAEEKRFGILSGRQQAELMDILLSCGSKGRAVRAFMKRNKLPFLATDRSVLNLPGIGKSMTVRLAGITSDGCRILCFSHDATRRHSPVINSMKEVYIVENKSVAAYLRQLHSMGEPLEAYASIWHYCAGETEPRFSLYQYPPFGFESTDKMSNLADSV